MRMIFARSVWRVCRGSAFIVSDNRKWCSLKFKANYGIFALLSVQLIEFVLFLQGLVLTPFKSRLVNAITTSSRRQYN